MRRNSHEAIIAQFRSTFSLKGDKLTRPVCSQHVSIAACGKVDFIFIYDYYLSFRVDHFQSLSSFNDRIEV